MADDRLGRYRSKRDFERTPEPTGEQASRDPDDAPRFVIQEHHATRLHWDLRLERDGTLLSWAIPRGLPWSPERNHLAVHTEDHPLEYLEFSGEIPEGSYGAGRMTIWDRGTYEPLEVHEDKVVVDLRGDQARGRYALFQTKGDDWMIHRMDPPADPGRRPPPSDWRPMRAVEGPLPDEGDAFAFELRWTGARCLLTVSGGRVDQIVTGDGTDVSGHLPEVRRLGSALGATEVVLDAVVVGVDRDGAPIHDSEAVDRRLAASADRASRLEHRAPVAALLVDVLWLDGHPTVERPYDERRAALEGLHLASAAWQTPGVHHGDGGAFLDAARAHGVAGVVAKRRDSRYVPGARSDDWIAVATARGRP